MLESLFGYPVYRGVLDVTEEQDKQIKEVINNIDWYTPSESGPCKWHCSVKTTYSDEELPSQYSQKFADMIQNLVTPCIAEMAHVYFDLKEQSVYLENDLWFNKYEKGDYQEFHDHLGEKKNVFSGIVEITEPTKTSGTTCFFNPSRQGKSFVSAYQGKCKDEFIHTALGDAATYDNTSAYNIIVFPSLIPHSVYQHKDEKPRYSFSFNSRLQ